MVLVVLEDLVMFVGGIFERVKSSNFLLEQKYRIRRENFFVAPRIFFLDSIIFQKKKFGDLTLSNIPPTNTTSSSSTTSTTSTSSIPSTNRRSTGLHPYIYSRLWLFQMRTAASGTEAESICLFRTSLSFRVQRNIVPL